MIIKISYFPEANDKLDAEAMDESWSQHSVSIEDAKDALDLLAHAIEIENRYVIPENAGADTLQPEEE